MTGSAGKADGGGMMNIRSAKFGIGQVVRHRDQPFRGVIIDVDQEYGGRTGWLVNVAGPDRPDLDQPFYHLLAESEDDTYAAYVSEQNLVADETGRPIRHPELGKLFKGFADDRYVAHASFVN